ncbi:MAG: hypothetical protein EXR66_07830 [Dehalococcoidia bacterium]|nr:hypothetical protein [Dehalococcoidia bacterium]
MWILTPKWWKGFYIAFPLSFAFVVVTGAADATFAIRVAFIWALSITLALWASEKLKERRRGPAAPPPDSNVPHGVDPNDLRRRR